MEYKMMDKAGACLESANPDEMEESSYDDYVSMHESSVDLPRFNPAPAPALASNTATNYVNMHATNAALPAFGQIQQQDQQQDRQKTIRQKRENTSMSYYTVPEGQKFLVLDKQGKGEIVTGPKRIWKRGKKFINMASHIAYPGEYLMVRYSDGTQEHIAGPQVEWFDQRVHHQIQKADALQIATKEAIVVYAENKDKKSVERRIVSGPAIFIPQPGEWLHTFAWHGSRGDGYKKVPGGMVFQKLWLMPDQMYHDVEDVRTADDMVLTIKLMVFFELNDLEKMLSETHDPIGDFINATSSDVIDLVGRYSFDEFKSKTEQLNIVDSYNQLLSRAEQIGYKIKKIVYRGYATSEALERMHVQAIERRTELKLKRETEEQTQELNDFQQSREFTRAKSGREQDKDQEQHNLEKMKLRHQQEMDIFRDKSKVQLEQKQAQQDRQLQHQSQSNELQVQYLDKLKTMDVNLISYLTQNRADQIIELRGESGKPHIHLPPTAEK